MGYSAKISGALAVPVFALVAACGLVENTPGDERYADGSGKKEPAGDDKEESVRDESEDSSVEAPPEPSLSTGGSGNRETPPALGTDFGDPPRPYRALEVATGRYHSCALLEDGRVKCWGENGYGQLGLGDKHVYGRDSEEMGDALPFVNLGRQRAKHIYAGRYTSCAMLLDNSVKCWGRVYLGQHPMTEWGRNLEQMGDALPALPLSLEYPVIDVALGLYTQCVVFADESIYCRDGSGQYTHLPAAPDSTLRDVVSTSSMGIVALYADDTVRKIGTSGAQIGSTIAHDTSHLASADGRCFLRTNGRLECMWADEFVLDDYDVYVTQMGSTEISSRSLSCGILYDGTVHCWGQDQNESDWMVLVPSYGLGRSVARVVLDRPIVQISHMGFKHFCALDVEGYVTCWNPTHPGSEVATGLSDADMTRLRPVDLGTYTGE